MGLSTEDLDRQVAFLSKAPNANLGCRQRHQLPPLVFTRSGALPKGVRAIGPYADGTYDVIRTCPGCTMRLVHTTTKDGTLLGGKPRRRYPKGYLARGMGRISPQLALGMGFARISDTLLANATPPAGDED